MQFCSGLNGYQLILTTNDFPTLLSKQKIPYATTKTTATTLALPHKPSRNYNQNTRERQCTFKTNTHGHTRVDTHVQLLANSKQPLISCGRSRSLSLSLFSLIPESSRAVWNNHFAFIKRNRSTQLALNRRRKISAARRNFCLFESWRVKFYSIKKRFFSL